MDAIKARSGQAGNQSARERARSSLTFGRIPTTMIGDRTEAAQASPMA
jgi:hypothetical protein